MKEDIADEDFYRVFFRSKESQIPILRGYDNDSFRTRLSVAKEVVRNFKQGNATLLDYTKYLLRLLWIRENWLRPEIIVHQQYDCQCIGIDKKEVIPLLYSAIWLFCEIEIDPDYPQKIINLLFEQGHIDYESTIDCLRCLPTMRYRLTLSGKDIAEGSDPRLFHILAPESTQRKEPIFDATTQVCGRTNWILQQAKKHGVNEKKAVSMWNDLPEEKRIKIDPKNFGAMANGAFRTAKMRLKKKSEGK